MGSHKTQTHSHTFILPAHPLIGLATSTVACTLDIHPSWSMKGGQCVCVCVCAGACAEITLKMQ